MATVKQWRRYRHRIWLILGALILLAGGYSVINPDATKGKDGVITNYPSFVLPEGPVRVTVISPHLDDETLGVGGTIAQLRKQGIQVSVVFMTNGDDNPIGADLQFNTGYPTPEQLIQTGITRQQEALKALDKLGVAKDKIYFLGLPDRGLSKILSPQYETDPYMASGTLMDHSPYPLSYIHDLPYSGKAAKKALIQALNELRPTLLLTTASFDKHKDHSSTASLVRQVLPNVESKPKVAFFVIHYPKFPRPKGNKPQSSLLPPAKLAQEKWQVLYLSPEEQAKKQEAVEAYASQLRIPQLGSLMKAMVRKNELLLPATP